MAVKDKKETVAVVTPSYQEQLNAIDKKIDELLVKKKAIAKLALKEASEAVVMPLHQLNAIAKLGYKAAKAKYGESWVE